MKDKKVQIAGLKPITHLDVIYEDNHIIAVNKQATMIVQGDKTGDKPMIDMVKEYIKEKYDKPGLVYAGVVHRIDRPVSGVVLFAKTSKALDRLNAMFKDREMKKTYWAIVKKRPPQDAGHLLNYLIKNPERNYTTAFDEPREGAMKSELDYKIIGKTDTYYLLEIKPITGRPHQIRTQLAKMGSPIRGDSKYGFQRGNTDLSINLHAREIEFIHPVKKEPIKITADLPTGGFWEEFMPWVEWV